MGNTEQYRLGGRTVRLHSADLQQIMAVTEGLYEVHHREGLVVLLDRKNSTPWRSQSWFVSFNPADLYYPHDWFHEASSNQGMVFNRTLHGPRAVDLFTEALRKGL